MGQGKDAIKLQLVSVVSSRRVNFLDRGVQFHSGVNAPAGKTFVVVDLKFTGLGSSGYEARVPQWSWLAVTGGGATATVRACGEGTTSQPYTDMQTSTVLIPEAVLYVGQNDTRGWKVAFLVPVGTRSVTFTYQGPDNIKATWVLQALAASHEQGGHGTLWAQE